MSVQALKAAGTNNPVMLLDEVDKLGSGIRGDPAAALLEVMGAVLIRLPFHPRFSVAGAGPRAEPRVHGHVPRAAFRFVQGVVHRHGEHPGNTVRAPVGPHGGDPTGWLHP